jgi:hypothetical protein
MLNFHGCSDEFNCYLEPIRPVLAFPIFGCRPVEQFSKEKSIPHDQN